MGLSGGVPRRVDAATKTALMDVAVFNEWGDIDRSHRKLAHRGSSLGRFWADPSTVRRVLERLPPARHPD